jgi:hypothetical protein
VNTFSNSRKYLLACLLVLSVCIFADQAQAAPAGIPKNEITALQQDFNEINSQKSTAKKRRSCKSIVRKGNSLIKVSPTAPNRFKILSIMLQSQKLLLKMDNSDRNRESLFEICGRLAKAPNTYASLRLDAELLFSTMKMDAKGASKEERVEVLRALVARYRDTPVEAKCLMIASMIAGKLQAAGLKKTIIATMAERFSDNPDVVEFRLKILGLSRIEVPFLGTFKRADGASLSFPIDRSGHAGIIVFWSKQMPGYAAELKKIHEQASEYAGQLSLFSFNVDELDDAGEKQLRDLGIDWTAVHLPGGKRSREFRIFGRGKPVGHMVSPYGHVLLMSSLAKYGHGHGAQKEVMVSEKMIPHTRYLAQLQSLFIGDFLVSETVTSPSGNDDSVPQEKLDAIHACFTPAPMRYRISPTEALAGYTKAEQLSRDAITSFPKAPDLWRVRNFRMISLLGMWKLTMDPKHLDAAVVEARATLATTLPKGADVVSQFCLAKAALRQDGVDPKSTLADLIKATGGGDAPASAYAATTILALDANSKKLHAHYRQQLLESDHDEPMLWPVVTYLRDPYHIFHTLQAVNNHREHRDSRGHIANNSWNLSARPLPAIELKSLDGSPLNLPNTTKGKLTLLLFVEPPADPAVEIPLVITGKPAEGKKREVQGAMRFANQLAAKHIHQDVEVVVAFLSDDTDRIKALVKKHALTCQVAIVPGGLKNPLVSQLGILSADRLANIFLLRRDGTIAWHTTGLKHKASFSHVFSTYLGMTVQIELCDITLAYKALEKGDYKEAARLFAGPFPKKRDERFRWTGVRFHARALANMQLKQWDTALEDIDKAIADHNPKWHGHRRGEPCQTLLELHRLRATILENLGRTEEAKAAQKLAAAKATPYRTSIYLQFHEKLKELRLKSGNP